MRAPPWGAPSTDLVCDREPSQHRTPSRVGLVSLPCASTVQLCCTLATGAPGGREGLCDRDGAGVGGGVLRAAATLAGAPARPCP
eukprot:355807-Prymnesium_polylepis.1